MLVHPMLRTPYRGVIEGVGTLSAHVTAPRPITNYGLISPGTSSAPVGNLMLLGNVDFQPSGSLRIDLTNQGHDSIIIDDIVRFGGELDLSVADDFVPVPYEPLQIVGTNREPFIFEGTFDSVTNVILDENYGLAVTYGADEVLVTAARLGDANLDGVVDVSDFNAWNENQFEDATWASGDFNGDGVADVSDFNIWNGQTFEESPLSVPEPSGLALLVVGVLELMRRSSEAV